MMDSSEFCSVGRTITNDRIPGFQAVCPSKAVHTVILAHVAEVVHFCDDHFIDFAREVDDIQQVNLDD